jgi:hypothetical protein
LYFEVLPNQANYIGTIKIETSCCYIKQPDIIERQDQGKVSHVVSLNQGIVSYSFSPIDGSDRENMPFVLWVRNGPVIYVDNWNILNEKEEAFTQFQKFYTHHPEPIVNLMSSMKKPWRQENSRDFEFFDIDKILEKYKIIDRTYYPPLTHTNEIIYRTYQPYKKSK